MLAFANRRMPLAKGAKHSPIDKRQILRCLSTDGTASIAEALAEDEAWPLLEAVDVVDGDGRPTLQLYRWPAGSGIIFEHGTTNVVADIVQHHCELHADDAALLTALAAAQATQPLAELIDFSPPKASQAKPASTASIDLEIAAMRAAVAAGNKPDDKALFGLVRKAFGTEYRPRPARRLRDLTSTEREALELLADAGKPCSYAFYGLPLDEAINVQRYLGRVPPGPLEELIEIDGNADPIWCVVHDVLYEQRPAEPVAALLRAFEPSRLLALWNALATTRAYGFRDRAAYTQLEFDRGTKDPTYLSRVLAFMQRFIDLLVTLNLALGDAGRAAAEPIARHDYITPALTGLACLDAHGALDESWDVVVIDTLRRSGLETSLPIALPWLTRMPPERAQRIAAAIPHHAEYIARFPSEAGARALIGVIETRSFPFLSVPDARLKKIVAGLGETARPFLVDAIARKPAKEKLLQEMLAALDKRSR